jgi:hypothetical protein
MNDKELSIELPTNGGISVLLVGSTRSGKTTITKHLLKKYFKDHIQVLMSPNIHAGIYKDLDKNTIVSPEFLPQVIHECYTINRKTDNHYDFLVVLDDVVNKKFDKDLLKLFTTHRNCNISGIQSIQSPILLNSAMRGNINVVMLGFMNSDESCEKVIRMFCYASVKGKNIEEKINEYKRLTSDHHWIVVNNLTGEIYRTKLRL